MHQSTQRRLCRWLFLLACVLPTLFVASWIAWRWQPGFRHGPLVALGGALGVRFECDQSETPRPGEIVCRGVRLVDPETGALLAELDRLHVLRQNGQQRIDAGVLVIDPQHLATLAETVRLSLRSSRGECAAIRFHEVQLGQHTRWQDAVLRVEDDASQGRVLLLAERATGAQLRLERNRQIEPPVTRFSIDTGDNAIAWRTIARLTPLPDELGTEAEFRGRLVVSRESSAGSLDGSIAGVDLAHLAPRAAAIKTDKPAAITSLRVAWRLERMTQLDLNVEAGAGQLAWRFAHLASFYVRCGAGPVLSSGLAKVQQTGAYSEAPLGFDELTLRIQADARGVRISSSRDQEGAAPLMNLAGAPLLYAPQAERTSIETLMRVVQSPDAANPFDCPTAAALAGRLPLCDAPPVRR